MKNKNKHRFQMCVIKKGLISMKSIYILYQDTGYCTFQYKLQGDGTIATC